MRARAARRNLGKRQEARGKRQEARGKRQEARGKRQEARPDTGPAPNLPVYLEAEVQAYLADRAKARGIDVAQLVNELLKKDIELIEAAR
jgi:hypothetical protein